MCFNFVFQVREIYNENDLNLSKTILIICTALYVSGLQFYLVALSNVKLIIEKKFCCWILTNTYLPILESVLHLNSRLGIQSMVRLTSATDVPLTYFFKFLPSNFLTYAQYFYSFKALCDASYKASQMFSFTTQCNQNKTFEKPKKDVVRGFEWLEILGHGDTYGGCHL